MKKIICFLTLMAPLFMMAQVIQDTTTIKLSNRTQDTMIIKVAQSGDDTLIIKVPQKSSDTIIKTEQKSDTSYVLKSKESLRGFGVSRDTMQWVVAPPRDNWYISAGVGIQTYIGNEVERSARFNPITPNLFVEVGKWVIPDLAISFNLSGLNAVSQSRYSLNPYIDFTDEQQDEYHNNPYKSFSFNYFAFTGQVALDWMNFICGYQRGREKLYHFQTMLGMGFAWETGEVKNPRKEGKASNFEYHFAGGINNEFRVSPRFTLNQTMKLLVIRNTFDYSSYDENTSKFDFIPSITVGLTFNLIKSAKHEFEKVKVITIVPEHLIRIEIDSADISNMSKQIQEQPQGNIPAQILYAIDNTKLASTAVYYEKNKAVLDNNAIINLHDFSDVIKNSDSDSKFLIIGSADSRTGTAEYNMKLSERRCKSVFNALTKDYGVDPEKLEMRPLGGIDDYEPYELNRVTIVVIDDPEVLKILDQEKKSNKNNQ